MEHGKFVYASPLYVDRSGRAKAWEFFWELYIYMSDETNEQFVKLITRDLLSISYMNTMSL
jgi:hypothetical protein